VAGGRHQGIVCVGIRGDVGVNLMWGGMVEVNGARGMVFYNWG
jgi:hypothetical protein